MSCRSQRAQPYRVGRGHNAVFRKRLNSISMHPNTHDQIIRGILEGLGTPKSLAVWLLYSNAESQQLLDLECSTRHYNDLELEAIYKFRDDYMAVELLSKADFLPGFTGKTRKDRAMKKFFDAERHCEQTNKRLRSLESIWLSGGTKDYQVASALQSMRHKISSVLGSFDSQEFVSLCDWGPGATTNLARRFANRYNKFLSEKGITEKCRTFCNSWFSLAFPLHSIASGLNQSSIQTRLLPFTVNVGDTLVAVPKKANIDRIILKQPGINLFLQKGLGRMMKRRLKRLNKIDPQKRNQQLCRTAASERLCTVDFSSASDMIAKLLPQRVFPEDWYAVMDATRCHFGLVDGKITPWEKFSAMGNGFTFEMESLIFWSLAVHCCESLQLPVDQVSVFGDDVIMPEQALPLFEQLSTLLGFKVNNEKTHHDSKFRESCGEHWFEKLNCKPLYIKRRPGDLEAIYHLANSIRNLSHRRNHGYGCDIRLRSAWRCAVGAVPEDLRFFGPANLGNSVLAENFDVVQPSVLNLRRHASFDAWEVFGIRREPRKVRMGDMYAALCRVLSTEVDPVRAEGQEDAMATFGFETKSGQGPITRTLFLQHDWYDYGPWYRVRV